MKKDARNALLGKLSAPYGTGIDRTVAVNVRLGGLMSACTDSEKISHHILIVNLCSRKLSVYFPYGYPFIQEGGLFKEGGL